jgi:hypothetical protein
MREEVDNRTARAQARPFDLNSTSESAPSRAVCKSALVISPQMQRFAVLAHIGTTA